MSRYRVSVIEPGADPRGADNPHPRQNWRVVLVIGLGLLLSGACLAFAVPRAVDARNSDTTPTVASTAAISEDTAGLELVSPTATSTQLFGGLPTYAPNSAASAPHHTPAPRTVVVTRVVDHRVDVPQYIDVTREVPIYMTRVVERTVTVPMTVTVEVTKMIIITATPAPTNTPAPTETPQPQITRTTPAPSAEPTAETPTVSPTPSKTPTATPSPTPTLFICCEGTETPTATLTASPTVTATGES